MAVSITPANPGNLVVPLSAIIDQLQGKLTAAELNALLLEIVGEKRNTVGRGDLITADLMNQILADLEDLQVRVATLEATGDSTVPTLRVTRIEGPTPIRVGSRVRVVGENFSEPATRNGIRVDFTPVPSPDTLSSTDTQLVFDMPDPGILSTGRNVTLSVTNSLGQTGSLVFHLEPLLRIPTGTLAVDYLVAPAGALLTAGSYDFGYRLTAGVSWTSSVLITAGLGGEPGWSARIFADDGTEIDGPVTFQPTGTDFVMPFRVRVTVPSGSSSAELTVGATEITPGTQVRPAPTRLIALARDAAVPAPDHLDRVSVELLGTSTQVTIEGGTAVFTAGRQELLTFRFNFRGLPGASETIIRLDFNLDSTSGAGWVRGNPSSATITTTDSSGSGRSSVPITPPSAASTTRLYLNVTADPTGQDPIDVTYVTELRAS